MPSLKINCHQYLTLQALFHATASDFSRISLTKVFYDSKKDLFVATNGHVLRVEKLEYITDTENPTKFQGPEFSFLLDKKDVLMTPKQFKELYGKNFLNQEIEIQYQIPEDQYPDYNRCIPDIDAEYDGIKEIGISFENLSTLHNSFYNASKNQSFRFKFLGDNLKAISVYVHGGDFHFEKFVGVVMPLRVKGNN